MSCNSLWDLMEGNVVSRQGNYTNASWTWAFRDASGWVEKFLLIKSYDWSLHATQSQDTTKRDIKNNLKVKVTFSTIPTYFYVYVPLLTQT